MRGTTIGSMKVLLFVGLAICAIEGSIALSPLTWRWIPVSLLGGAVALVFQQRRFARRLKASQERGDEQPTGQ